MTQTPIEDGPRKQDGTGTRARKSELTSAIQRAGHNARDRKTPGHGNPCPPTGPRPAITDSTRQASRRGHTLTYRTPITRLGERRARRGAERADRPVRRPGLPASRSPSWHVLRRLGGSCCRRNFARPGSAGRWATDPAVVRRLVGHEHADLQRGLRGCRERVGKCADVPELAEAHTQRRGTGGEPREA